MVQRLHSRVGLSIAILLGAAAAVPAAPAESYFATPIGTLGGVGSAAFGVNDAGQVVGAAETADGAIHACVYSGGQFVDLGTLANHASSAAFSINDAGVIVGQSSDANGVERAVRWLQNGPNLWEIEDLGTLGGAWAIATRVNAGGQITGYAALAGGNYHAFLWSNGSMTDLGTLHWTGPLAYSQGLGLNDAGDVVGFAYRVLSGPEHGFVYDDGMQRDITPAEPFGLAQGWNINAAGVIGGYIAAAQTAGAFRAGYYTPGEGWTVIPLLPGHADSYGYDINDSGALVGVSFQAQRPGEDVRGFLHTAGQTIDLNAVTANAPAQIIEAWDLSNGGLIAANADAAGLTLGLLLSPLPRGDANCDGNVDFFDIDPFLLALFDPSAYAAAYCSGATAAVDVDCSGGVDFFDIDPFLGCLFGTCPACP